MTQTIVERNKLAIQTKYLDLAVAEVFEVMMGVACQPVISGSAVESNEGGGVTAIVGLAGTLHGACVMRMRQPAALKLAERMVGAPMASFDRTVKDALGEACNMLAGAWKGKLEGFSSSCMLSVPAVISGSNYEINMPAPAFHLDRTYFFEGQSFTFTIDCAGL
jgi:chemotaxis protein CheX